jgi:integrase
MVKQLRTSYRLYKRGETYWAYFSIPDEKGSRIRFRETTGTTNPKRAEQYCLDRLASIQQEKTRKTATELAGVTLDAAFGDYFRKHAQYFARPAETLRKLGKILSNLSVEYLHEIDNNEISDYIQRRKAEVSNGTINRELVILSSIITKCRLWKYKTSDVRPIQFKLKEKAENIKYLKDWETAQKIIDRAKPHLKPIIYTALYTGLRRGNILGLMWENLDFQNDLINVKVKDRTKDGGKNLTIPMIAKLKEILLAQPRVNKYVFNYNGAPMADIKHSWHSIFYDSKGNLKDPTLPYTNFHTLRHTAATWILKSTNNLKITQEILGHSNISTTMKYAHVMADEKRRALDSVFSN